MYVCMHVHMYGGKNSYYVYVDKQAQVYTCLYVSMYVGRHALSCIYVCMHICMFVHICM